MLEESRMDKKTTNRSLQQSRPHAVDCKKGTETTYKPWPRNNKKREGPSSAPKNELRKNVPSQRGRGQLDKRPRCRSSNFLVGGTQNTRIEEDDEPEIGSVFVPGSKKQNLNHLLNFMYPSRGGTEHRGPAPRRINNQRVAFKHQHDLYLRAYCQFVVKETGDYKANLVDPDMPLKWEQIEEIVVRVTGKSECPICLGTPVAGRVGLCGHVYCWACILHYGATHEKQPPPCPVCATALHVPDMKPASVVQWESPADEVTMRLVRRPRGSTVVEIAPPCGELTESIEPNILPLENHIETPYAKLFTATNKQIFNILERDRKEIKDQILAEIDTTEIIYLEQALEMLKTKEEKLKLLYSAPPVNITYSKDTVQTVYEKVEVNEKRIDWFDVTDEDVAAATNVTDKVMDEIEEDMSTLDLQSNLNPNATEFTLDNNDNCVEEFPLIESPISESESNDNDSSFIDIYKQNQAKYFYFYQAVDGQQVFLHSLNVRLLNASWGALAAAPPIVSGRVLHRETHFLSEQTRKHMPCTAHLPLHCAFDVVELDLKLPYVTSEALNNFSDDIERRARIRAKHERDEKRRERAYRRTVDGPPKPDISSELLFPPTASSYGSPPFMEYSVPRELSSPSTSTSSATVEHSSPSLHTSSPPSGLSFAKMASTGGIWRVRKVTAPIATPPVTEEEMSGPRALVLSDAIEAALQASTPNKPTGKKKKSKPKVLFATGMHHAG